MSKVIVGVVVVVAMLVLGLPVTDVNAQATMVKISRAGCGVLDGAGRLVIISARVHDVRSAGGTSTLTCQGRLPAFAVVPSRAAHFDFAKTGLPCGTFFGITRDWKEVATPSGHVTLVCKIKR